MPGRLINFFILNYKLMKLMDFAPYIQFIVGIYFVCMYDKILEINPLHKFFVRSTDKLKKNQPNISRTIK